MKLPLYWHQGLWFFTSNRSSEPFGKDVVSVCRTVNRDHGVETEYFSEMISTIFDSDIHRSDPNLGKRRFSLAYERKSSRSFNKCTGFV